MSGPIKQDTTLPKSEFLFLICAECNHSTKHQVLAETKSHWQDDEGIVDLWAEHQIIQCQGCMTIAFSKATQFSEDWDIDPRTGEHFIPIQRSMYPEHFEGRSTLPETHLLPSKVRRIYEETHSSLNAKMRVMTGFGIRAIVEAVCKDKSINGRNLEKKIDNLATGGLITTEGAAILHSLRFMGNEAAHEIKEHTAEELNAAIDVVEYLLKGVYVIPKLAEKITKEKLTNHSSGLEEARRR